MDASAARPGCPHLALKLLNAGLLPLAHAPGTLPVGDAPLHSVPLLVCEAGAVGVATIRDGPAEARLQKPRLQPKERLLLRQ